jgi:hypothetical protein
MDKMKTRSIAMSGVLLGLSVATLFGATFIPGIELTLFTLSSFYVAIVMIELTPGTGWIFYLASVMFAFMIVPNKGGLIPYTIFFGLYAIVKYYIESLKKFPQPVEILLKLVFCNIMLAVGVFVFGPLFLSAIQVPDVAWPVLIIGAQIFFIAYDYILTLVIGFYLRRRPKA